MPESVPRAQQNVEVSKLVRQMRSRYPGVVIDVWSPNAEEHAVDGMPATYQEVVIDTPGSERYVIPLHGDDSYELWRVGVNDPPGAGELLGQADDLTAVVTTGMDAAAAQADPGRVPVYAWVAGWQPLPTVPAEIAGWSPHVNSLASQALHGGRSLNTLVDHPTTRRDHDALRDAFQRQADRLDDSRMDDRPGPLVGSAVLNARAALRTDDLDATLRHLVMANDLRRHGDPARATEPGPAPATLTTRTPDQQRDTAVSNAWRSDMTAAAGIEAESRGGVDRAPLRKEEIALLERVDPATAETARTADGRAAVGRSASSHRRPERTVEQQVPGRDRGRSVDGSD